MESVCDNLVANLERLCADLSTRRYPAASISDALSKVLLLNRSDCLKKVFKSGKEHIPLVIPYHRALPQISTNSFKTLEDPH